MSPPSSQSTDLCTSFIHQRRRRLTVSGNVSAPLLTIPEHWSSARSSCLAHPSRQRLARHRLPSSHPHVHRKLCMGSPQLDEKLTACPRPLHLLKWSTAKLQSRTDHLHCSWSAFPGSYSAHLRMLLLGSKRAKTVGEGICAASHDSWQLAAEGGSQPNQATLDHVKHLVCDLPILNNSPTSTQVCYASSSSSVAMKLTPSSAMC